MMPGVPEERHLYRGSVGTLGIYRAVAGDRLSGSAFRKPLMVFPRAAVFVEGRRQAAVADATTALLYNEGERVRVRYLNGIDRCDYLALTPAWWEELTGEAGIRGPGPAHARPFSRFDVPVPTSVLWAVRSAVASAADADTLELEEAICWIARSTLQAASDEEPAAPRDETRIRHRRLVADAKELIASDPAASLLLSDLAAAVGASPFHLSRVFRAVSGHTLSRYRSLLRLASALEQIGTDDLSGLAVRHGFSSHSHFASAFRAEFGIPPSHARTQLGRPEELFRRRVRL